MAQKTVTCKYSLKNSAKNGRVKRSRRKRKKEKKYEHLKLLIIILFYKN